MTSSPPLRRQGNPARAAAVAGAVAAFVLLERSLLWWVTTIGSAFGSAVMADMGIRTLLHFGRTTRGAAEADTPGQT